MICSGRAIPEACQIQQGTIQMESPTGQENRFSAGSCPENLNAQFAGPVLLAL